MKIAAVAFLLILVSLLGFEIFSLWSRKANLEGEFEESQAKLEELKKEQGNLRAEINYLANPLNLEKELRSRFNLKYPSEKMIIVVPRASSTDSP